MADKNSAWRSPWVIAWVAMVVIFFTMNMIMIFLAVDNNPGLVDDDFYERGQDYEANMLKRQARNPGWLLDIDLPKKIPLNKEVTCRVRIKDNEGNLITPDSVTFYAYRPSDADMDFSVPMNEIDKGVYEIQVAFPLKGAWDLIVSVTRGEDEYNTPKRIGVDMDWIP
jgi:nitrogen fixation protein FixH